MEVRAVHLSNLAVNLVTPGADTVFATCSRGPLVAILLFRPTVLSSTSVLLSNTAKHKDTKWHQVHGAQEERLSLQPRMGRERCGVKWKRSVACGVLVGELLCKRHTEPLGCQTLCRRHFLLHHSAIANCQQHKDTCTSQIVHLV